MQRGALKELHHTTLDMEQYAMQVQAQVNTGDYAGRSVTVEFPPLDVTDLSGLIENFGEEVIFNHSKRSFVISLQAYIRAQIESGKSPEEIQEAVNEWRPGQRRPAKTPSEKAQELLGKLNPAEREALLAEYRARMQD